MSQFRPAEVWTEREIGDWEACVATSYAMGLLYGGVTMPAPYTQAERERLEVRADEPQDLTATDAKAMAVYGARLRGPSVTSSVSAFLARPGLGFCLTGTGSPVGAQVGTFIHEVFAIATGPTVLAIYDPLLPAGSAPVARSVALIAAWMRGIAPHQVREVRKDELAQNQEEAMAPGVKQAGTPIGTFTMPAGQHQLISPIDTKIRYPQPAGGTWPVVAIVDLKTPGGKPLDIDGNTPPRNGRDQVYLVDAPSFGVAAYALRVDGTFTPAPTGGISDEDHQAAVKAAKHSAAAAVAAAADSAAGNFPP